MSQAYRCDICGNCVDNEDEAKSQREVAKESATINGVSFDIGIIIKGYLLHICDPCWTTVMSRVKAWVNAHID